MGRTYYNKILGSTLGYGDVVYSWARHYTQLERVSNLVSYVWTRFAHSHHYFCYFSGRSLSRRLVSKTATWDGGLINQNVSLQSNNQTIMAAPETITSNFKIVLLFDFSDKKYFLNWHFDVIFRWHHVKRLFLFFSLQWHSITLMKGNVSLLHTRTTFYFLHFILFLSF